MKHHSISLAIATLLGLAASPIRAADVVVQPAAGNGFVVKDAAGANERFRVQETGAVSLPSVAAAPAQPQGLCMSAAGQLGPCSAGTGSSYTAATGLSLAGTTFSVAPTYRLPQGCAANQIAQWNGTAWACGTAGGGALPPGTVNQTLRYDASNTPVANNLLQAFADGGLVAGGETRKGSIPTTGAGARMMWHPAKAAFRAGFVDGMQWDDASVGFYSFATGENSIASGFNSMATGTTTKATGTSSTALGVETIASGFASIATGRGSQAGGDYSTAMGYGNHATRDYSVALGLNSAAQGRGAVAIGAGVDATGDHSTAMGSSASASGDNSTALGNSTIASGAFSTAMGRATRAEGNNSTALGYDTKATGNYSTAMGSNAQTDNHEGSFVYGDGSRITQNTGDHQFTVRASGGFVFLSDDSPGGTAGVQLKPGSGAWDNLSDRNAKTAFESVDARDVLARVVSLPLSTWHYKAQDASDRHMGPMAQDFYAAFHLGDSDKSINTIDADGVALAAIQGLNARLDEKDREIATLRTEKDREIAALRTRISSLESVANDIAEVKSQLAALRQSAPAAVAVALRQP